MIILVIIKTMFYFCNYSTNHKHYYGSNALVIGKRTDEMVGFAIE